MTITIANVPSAPHLSLRVALIVLGVIVTLRALVDLPAVFLDFGHTDPLAIFAQRVTTVQIAVTPFIAAAALVLAARGHLRHAIVAFATIILVGWVAELPSILIHRLDLSAGGLFLFVPQFVYPLIAGAAILLAVRNARLPLAAALVAVPTALGFLGVMMFAIGVAIYGF